MSYECDVRKTAGACDIGGTIIACGRVDLDAEKMPQVHDVKKIPTEADLGGAHVLELVIQSIKDALARAEERGEKPVGVGISSAGVVDPRSGNITFANDHARVGRHSSWHCRNRIMRSSLRGFERRTRARTW